MKKILLPLLIFCLALTACGGEPTSTPESAMSPFTATVTKNPLITGSPTPTFTKTFSISATPSPTIDYTQQAWHSTAVVFQGTEGAITQQASDNYATQIAQFSINCEFLGRSQISPDENWIAQSCGYNRDQTLIVKNRQGVTWILKYKDLMLHEYMGSIFPESWSPEGNFLYFSTSIGYSGGGDQCFPSPADSPTHYDVSQGLFQLNLNNGTWVTLIPPTTFFPGYNIKFSPTGRRYAVDINGITIFDIKSGDSVQIDAPGLMDFIWSPDGRHLAYSISKCDEAGWAQSASVYVWDSKTNEVQHHFTVREEKTIIYPESWVGNSTLRVLAVERVGYDNFYEAYVYDIVNNQLIFSGTATPSP